jgi:exopolysaccharide biosynthesis protein
MENGDMKRSVKNQELYKYGLCLPLNHVDGNTVFEWWHIQPVETLGYAGDRTKFLDSDDKLYDPKVRPVVVMPKPVEVSKPMNTLQIGSRGNDVYEMQLMLNKLGFNCGMADGVFGNGTNTQVVAFQKANKLTPDGVAGSMTLAALTNLFYAKCTTIGYRAVRDYGSTIHIYESSKAQDCDIVLSPTRQPLSKINDASKQIVCKINAGFFNMLPTNQDSLGLFIDEGKYLAPENVAFIDLIYFKDGHTQIGRVVDLAKASELQGTAKWAIGTSWTLVVDGHINIQNTQYFDHAATNNPRTLFGQRKDGTWVLVVVQGREMNEAGVTAKQEAELMFRLGCMNACNLDGGGSSTFILNNHVMNYPTDGSERAVRAAVFIYNK